MPDIDAPASAPPERSSPARGVMKYVAAVCFLAFVVTLAQWARRPLEPAKASSPPAPTPSPAPASSQAQENAARVDQLSARLEQLSARMDQLSTRLDRLTVSPPAYPSASAIASEVVKQTVKETPPPPRPSLAFEVKASSVADGHLQFAVFVVTRRGTPATDFNVKPPSGVSGWIDALPGAGEADRYQLSFQPQSGNLPNAWTFALTYVNGSRKMEERTFHATFDPKQPPPASLRVTEKVE